MMHTAFCLVFLFFFTGIVNAEAPEAIDITAADNTPSWQDIYTAACTLHGEGTYNDALALFQQGCFLFPHSSPLFFQLGNTLLSLGMIDYAIESYRHALTRPGADFIPIAYNIAYALKAAGRLDQALSILHTIIAHDPDYEPARLACAFAYLMKGDYEKGFYHHEWNLKKQGKFSSEIRSFALKNDFSGLRICLIPEGGYGDTIHFFRYAKLLKDKGAFVIARVQNILLPLLANCPFVDVLEAHSSAPAQCHGYATYMSMPTLLQDTEKTIPTTVPYIFADPSLSQAWKEKIARDNPGHKEFTIGIAWQPSLHNDISRTPIAWRGIPLSLFKKFETIPDIIWYSLQRSSGTDQIKDVVSVLHIIPCDPSFDRVHGAFTDTAALIENLDLIITTDSATMHIAAAMGRPVMLLLPFLADWRWLAHGDYSPWYPTVTIFKQKRPFDWISVIDELYNAVLVRVNNHVKKGVCYEAQQHTTYS